MPKDLLIMKFAPSVIDADTGATANANAKRFRAELRTTHTLAGTYVLREAIVGTGGGASWTGIGELLMQSDIFSGRSHMAASTTDRVFVDRFCGSGCGTLVIPFETHTAGGGAPKYWHRESFGATSVTMDITMARHNVIHLGISKFTGDYQTFTGSDLEVTLLWQEV